MRFVHIADSHLGLAAFNRLDPECGMNLREKQVYDNFLEGIEVIIRQRPEALVHAGDLFDRVKPKTRAYTTVLSALERLREEEIPLVIISGNHSMPKTRYTTSPFEVLGYHPAEIHAAFRYRYEKAEIGGTVFHLLPNMLHAEDYAEAFNEITPDPSSENVLVTHGLVDMLSDKRLRTVAEHELDATILSPEFDYIALGHYHSQQQVTENAWYSGSQEFCNYGEIHDTKGGLIVDTSFRSVKHLDLPHTPMINLGTIHCSGLQASEVLSKIRGALESLSERERDAMCVLTLDDIQKETMHTLPRREIADLKSRVLNLKVRVNTRDEENSTTEATDIRAVDYVSEFSTYLDTQQIDQKSREFILKKGQQVLRTVTERHQENKHAAE